ncbi:hypothetical protein ACQ4PT_011624 [Festuca glaucescens]
MEEPLNPSGGGGGHSVGSGVGNSSSGGGGGHDDIVVDDLDELWPSRPSTAAVMLAHIWVDNPATSYRFTSGLGGVDLDPEIWDIRIHLDGVDNIERTLARDDITLMNIIALIEMKGYNFDLVVYDVWPPAVFSVDGEGTVFPSQGGSACSQNPYVCTPESINDQKGKGIQLSDSDDDDADMGLGTEAYGDMDFDMGEADFDLMEQMRRKEQEEITERIERMRKKREDPLLHCEGDADIEDLFVTADDTKVVDEPVYPNIPADAAPPATPFAPTGARQAPAPASPRQAPAAPGQAPAPAAPTQAPAAPRQAPAAPSQAPAAARNAYVPKSAFVAPISVPTIGEDTDETTAAAFKKTRTWSYFNCGCAARYEQSVSFVNILEYIYGNAVNILEYILESMSFPCSVIEM